MLVRERTSQCEKEKVLISNLQEVFLIRGNYYPELIIFCERLLFSYEGGRIIYGTYYNYGMIFQVDFIINRCNVSKFLEINRNNNKLITVRLMINMQYNL